MEVNLEIVHLLSDKNIKPKEKTATLCDWILHGKIVPSALIKIATASKDPAKATCIEAFEFATRQRPQLSTIELFEFVTDSLSVKAPRIKWESAKVIGNIAHLFSDRLDRPIAGLLGNSEHAGTVVRWSAAFALGQILKLNTGHNKALVPAIQVICGREEKNSIRKIYLEALNKIIQE